MKITVHTIINVYCPDGEATEMDVLGTFIDENEARKCFEEQKQEKLKLAEELGWEIDDNEMNFVAYEDGNFNNNFEMLEWHTKEIDLTNYQDTNIIKGE